MKKLALETPSIKRAVNTSSELGGVAAGYSVARGVTNKLPEFVKNPWVESGLLIGGGITHAAVSGDTPVALMIKGVSLGVAFYGANKLIQRGAREIISYRDTKVAQAVASGQGDSGETLAIQNGLLDGLAAGLSDNYYSPIALSATSMNGDKIAIPPAAKPAGAVDVTQIN